MAKMDMNRSLLEGNTIHILRKLLLDHRELDVNAQDAGGNTALHYATVNGQNALVESLLSKGANVNMTNLQGVTPAHSAAMQNDVNTSLLFLKHGLDLQITTPEGKLIGDLATDAQLKQTLYGLRTSLTYPFSVSYVDLTFVGKKLGRLGIAMCPGRKYKKIWSRDLLLDLEFLVQKKM